jgi:hypothetical protein
VAQAKYPLAWALLLLFHLPSHLRLLLLLLQGLGMEMAKERGTARGMVTVLLHLVLLHLALVVHLLA